MNEIICPHCKKAFKIDEAGFADILKQVRDHEFEEQLRERVAILERDKDSAVRLAEEKTKNQLASDLAQRDSQIADLKSRAAAKIKQLESDRELAATRLTAEKDAELAEMKSQLNSSETEKQLALVEAVAKIERERDQIASQLKTKDTEQQLAEASLKREFDKELKLKDEMIERYKDMKARLSTKMVGETLEQHCEIEFEKLRATAFQNATFQKDNDASSGSKGDYIYREFDDSGTEIISIMFEMKNQNDETATKKKNEDFLKELDKDRTEKKCEYGVLVSLLEADSELYNAGIVDKSHLYDKMYVVRPQFFIPIITLLRNAAYNSLKYKQELAVVRNQNIDITNFEDKLNEFKTGVSRNADLTLRQFETAIGEIDKSIDRLNKAKDSLLKSGNNLRIANNKIQEVSVKRLTRGNPTMADKFDQLADK